MTYHKKMAGKEVKKESDYHGRGEMSITVQFDNASDIPANTSTLNQR